MGATEIEIAKSAAPDPADDAPRESRALVALTLAGAAQHDRNSERPAGIIPARPEAQ
jgi:hypothetical protein